ncbi:hypothetical protein [Marmoricola sp. RAF53]|uniref:hypothetical protein n=1 Tax=Marmoricola sp. RAF53 TaxID=3233059 RepID=UPI003F9B3F22
MTVAAAVVLRVRLTGGGTMDVTYEDNGAADEAEVIEQVVARLASDAGLLRCRHGGRLVVLYARGVSAIEVEPRGAIL